ncbi:MAG TPA: hypothetical protein VF174_05605 [Micromonosporaceae bacterium]
MTEPTPGAHEPPPAADAVPPTGDAVSPAPGTADDRSLRLLGAVVAVVAAADTAILELLLSTVRVGGRLVGVSAGLAVVANAVLAHFARRAVGSVWAVALPATVWLAVMMAAATRTTEGDLLLAGDNWVGPVMIFAGSLTFAVVVIRMILSAPMDRSRRG